MAGNRTRLADEGVPDFVAAIPDPGQRDDAEALSAMIARVTGEAALVWDN